LEKEEGQCIKNTKSSRKREDICSKAVKTLTRVGSTISGPQYFFGRENRARKKGMWGRGQQKNHRGMGDELRRIGTTSDRDGGER